MEQGMDLYSAQERLHGDPAVPPRMAAPSLLDHVAVAIYSVAPDGTCTQINAEAVRLLGYSEAECIGRNMHELIHAKRPDGSHFPIEDCPLIQTRHGHAAVYNLDETVWSKSGMPIRVACSSVPILTNGELHGTVITMAETAAQHHAEERLRRVEHEQREILRQREAAVAVERATAAELREQRRMTEDRLVQSEKLAAVGRLAASISHEINNPLEAVTNLLYLVRNDRSLSTQGSNNFPDAGGQPTGDPVPTKTFQRYLAAVKNLVGGRAFE